MIWIASLAAGLGTALGLWHLQPASRPPMWAGLAHGAAGAAAVAAMFLAGNDLHPRTESFLAMARAVSAMALASGCVVLMRRRKGAGAVLAAHAGLGVAGYVLLLAWSQAG